MGRKSKLGCLSWKSGNKSSSVTKNNKNSALKSTQESSPDSKGPARSDARQDVTKFAEGSSTVTEKHCKRSFDSKPKSEPTSVKKETEPETATVSSISRASTTLENQADEISRLSPDRADATAFRNTSSNIGRTKMDQNRFISSSTSNNSQTFAHNVEKSPSKSHFSQSFSNEGSSSEESNGPKVYKKEFVMKKCRRRVTPLQNNSHGACKQLGESELSPFANCSRNACDVGHSASTLFQSPSSPSNRDMAREPMRETELGFFTNCSRNTGHSFSSQFRDPMSESELDWFTKCSRNIDHSGHSASSQLQSFHEPMSHSELGRFTNISRMTDHAGHFSLLHTRCLITEPSPEMAITVREKGGKSLRVTIVEGQILAPRPQDSDFTGDDTMHVITSQTRYKDQETTWWKESRGHCAPTASNARYNTPQPFNDLAMARNLAKAENLSADATYRTAGKALKSDQGCPKSVKAPSKSPHFELSMASYSKLIAYCGTGRGGQQMPRLGRQLPQLSNNSLATNDDSYASPGQINDLCRLAKVLATLEECTWYWGALSGAEAKNLLSGTELGTFLLRDSSDSRHLFSLSVQTHRGPTSIRIVYSDGTFRFDSDMDDANAYRRSQQNNRQGSTNQPNQPDYVKKVTPVFTCVLKMLLHYTTHLAEPRDSSIQSTENDMNSSENLACTGLASQSPKKEKLAHPRFVCYWVDNGGRKEVPILLSKPLSKKTFPSLQRLCRRTLSVSLRLWDRADLVDQLPLPNLLKKYLKRYPYPV